MPTNPFTIDPRDYKYGARGDQIVALQEALVFAGYEVSADGIFGDETRRALERFEIDHSYNDTLSLAVDQRTLTMLFNQVGVDFGPTPPTEPEPTPPSTSTPVLSISTSGDTVGSSIGIGLARIRTEQ